MGAIESHESLKVKNVVCWIKETRWRKEGRAGVRGTSPALVSVADGKRP